jgi:hypothetical protein
MNPHSDLRAVEGRLRAGLHDPSWPGGSSDADALLRRVARARRRRPALIVACLAILAVVAGTTYAAAGRSLRAAPPVSGTTSPTAEPLPSDLAMNWPPQAYFADAKHGYVVLKSCAGVTTPAPLAEGRATRQCPVYLAATDDGGLSWRPRAVPGATAPDSSDLVTNVLFGSDADHLVLQATTGGPAIFSRDGGRTWIPVPTPTETTDEVPQDGVVIVLRPQTGLGSIRFVVIRTDGRAAQLTGPTILPGLPVTIDGQVGVSSDGTLWIRVVAEGLPNWDYVSRDHGGTWFEVRGPAGTGVIYRTSGPNLYAADDQKRTLWTSKDGAHWDQVAVPATAPGTHLLYEPQSDGALLIGDPSGRRAYLAEGLRYTEEPVDEHMFSQHVGAGCIKAVRDGAPFNLVSTRPAAYDLAPDCVHWGRFPFAIA